MTRPDDDILIHRVIARLNVGGPAMHVVHLTRAFDGRPVPVSPPTGPEPTGRAADSAASRAAPSGPPAVPTFRARLITGSVLETEGDMEYYASDRGVTVVKVPSMARTISPLRDLRSLVDLWKLFRRERPAVVHTHTAKAGALGRLAAVLAGVPVRVHTYHGHVLGGAYFPESHTDFFLFVERLLAGRTHRLIVLTEAQRQEMSGRLGIAAAEKFSVVPLGLELEPFAEVPIEDPTRQAPGGRSTSRPGSHTRTHSRIHSRTRSRRELDLDEEDAVVGIVGRLVPIKNHELALDALAVLRPTRQVVLMVVGSGEREEELRRYAEAAGVADAVRWLGWRRDLPEILPALDVLALPSKDEGTPVAVMEALAAGIPVVARDVGGVSEVLEGGRWGRLVESDDARGFAEALEEALERPPSPSRRAEARRSVLERFGVERLVGDLEKIYLAELG